MRKFFLYLVPSLFFVASLLLMTSGGWLKEPVGKSDDVLFHVENIEQYIQEKRWEEAASEHKKALQAWDQVSKRVQFSAERDIINEIKGSLSRIKGGIKAQNANTTLSEIYYFYGLWEDLT
ncbi:DUF4363 family protein [Thalassorhabdus alkalitolerans]|uniref:DUF4363 family protein n=1 Tax=Thalassorhabdus alkalitolerans TaxID=2282697 RepID=A0ABW0YRH8_9BACI